MGETPGLDGDAIFGEGVEGAADLDEGAIPIFGEEVEKTADGMGGGFVVEGDGPLPSRFGPAMQKRTGTGSPQQDMGKRRRRIVNEDEELADNPWWSA